MKVALLGFGKAGKVLFSELLRNPLIQSISIYDPDWTTFNSVPNSISKSVEFTDERFPFDLSFDFIVVASPDNSHINYISEAIEKKIPTFVEKPYLSSIRDIGFVKELLKHFPNYQSTSNLVLRSSPLFREIKKLYSKGIFGKRVFIEGKYLYGRWEKLESGWRGLDNYSVTLGGLIHIVDLACFITDNYAYENQLSLGRLTFRPPISINDYSQLSLNSEKTGFLSLATNFSAAIDHRRDFAIYGDLACVEVRGQQVWASDAKLGYLEKLSSMPAEGELLREFISQLNGYKVETSFPSIREIFQVLDLCIGKSTI